MTPWIFISNSCRNNGHRKDDFKKTFAYFANYSVSSGNKSHNFLF
jgi:hypothetical protein